jgi:exonuclease SbcC
MKLKSLKGKGIGGCRKEFSLPVDQLADNDRIIAITGGNGAGKTTLFECLPGVLYGDVPSHGSLAAMANDAGSFVDGVVETDQAYRLLRKIKATRKQPVTEAYIFDAEGSPLNDGKQSTFTEQVAKRFPSKDTYLASGFSAQGRDGQFLEISKADRKALFADMIGCGHLQKLSEASGKRAIEIEKGLGESRAAIEALDKTAACRDERAKSLEASEETLAHVTKTREQVEFESAENRRKLDAWTEEKAKLDRDVTMAEGDLRDAKNQHAHATEWLDRLNGDLAKSTAQLATLRSKIGQRDALEKVVACTVDDRLAEVEKELVETRKDIDFYHNAEREWREELNKAEKALLFHREAYKTAVDKAESGVRDAERDLDAGERAASGLDKVPCHGDGEYATCPLITTATKAAGGIDGLRKRLAEAKTKVEQATADTAAGKAAKAALEAVGEAPEEPDSSSIYKLEGEAKLLRARHAEIVEAKAKLEAIADAEEQISRLEDEAESTREQLDGGPDALADMAKSVAGAEGKLLAIQDRSSLHMESKPSGVKEDFLADLRRKETQATAEVARAREVLAAAERAAEQVEELRASIKDDTADLDDWKHLQKALGRDGVQALEVDAAGPEVSDLVNDLLHSCFGSRFTAKLETTALKADGKGTKEVFDLMVLDSEMGREGSASDLSGGERVIVAEALSLAIAIFNTRRSSIPILDLWRDEACGALDVDNAPRYPVMLRKALEIGGFHRVFFISHVPELWALADRTIEVIGGQARIADVTRETEVAA